MQNMGPLKKTQNVLRLFKNVVQKRNLVTGDPKVDTVYLGIILISKMCVQHS